MEKQKNHKIKTDLVTNLVINITIILFTAIVFYALYFVVIASISDPDKTAAGEVLLLPKGVSFKPYWYIFRDKRIVSGYANSIFYTFFGTLLSLFITIPAAYALSRQDFVGRKVIMRLMLFTMYFGGGLIPTYMVIDSLNLVNTRAILVILGSFSVYNLILARTFFQTNIPLELQEAAEIDGCGVTRFFFSIALPLSKSIIAIMTLYYAVARWNSFFDALIYISSASKYPLQLILRDILIQGQNLQADVTDPDAFYEMQRISRTIRYGVIIVSSLPVLIIYPFVQKHFVKGVMIGSVKG